METAKLGGTKQLEDDANRQREMRNFTIEIASGQSPKIEERINFQIHLHSLIFLMPHCGRICQDNLIFLNFHH